jgi:hypothetical protein
MVTAEALLGGPRGRRLCWSVLGHSLAGDADGAESWTRVWLAAGAGDLSGCLDELASCVARAGPVGWSARPGAVFTALSESVQAATYWQEPDPEERALASDPVSDVLWPIAAAIAAAPETIWWTSPMDPERQRYAQFLGGHPSDEPSLSGAAQRVAAWRTDTADREDALRAKPPEALGAWSGQWWSDPALSGLLVSTRARPGLGAVRLALVEDGHGWQSARCWPLRPWAGARVYEVDGPAAWGSLVARYPLDVSRSRRHDWWRATGRAGRWLIPDYQAVARDYDAVHVSVLGYLTTAGAALPAGPDAEARTLLAGWDPDATWWLTDSLAPAGVPETWAVDAGGWVGSGWQIVR